MAGGQFVMGPIYPEPGIEISDPPLSSTRGALLGFDEMGTSVVPRMLESTPAFQ